MNELNPAPDEATTRDGGGIAADFIRFVLPLLAVAGRYSVQIQHRVQARKAKGGDNVFQQALTDADLSVQAFLEVAILSRFPEFSFFSEEYADSLNAKYFPSGARFEVLVDPIDGTRAYLDGAAQYQIIVTLREFNVIAAVLCHLPRRGTCYVALKGAGSSFCTLEQMDRGESNGGPVQLSPGSRRIVVFKAPEVKRLLATDFEVIDIFEEHARTGIHHGFTEILEGQAAACIHPDPQLIDAAAIAFVAQEAGGTLSDLRGQALRFDHAPTERGPGLVVSASTEFHREVLERLAHLH